MPDTETFVTIGVDTHKDTPLAVALEQLGRFLDAIEIPTTSAGYGDLLVWISDLGTGDRFGIEGTGSHGAGLCRWLTARGGAHALWDRLGRLDRSGFVQSSVTVSQLLR